LPKRWEIWKRFTFDAAHQLPMVPPKHKCARMHGHTYTVTLYISGSLSAAGWVIDYGQVSEWWRVLNSQLDHHTLNTMEGLDNPTAERLAEWIAWRLVVMVPPGITLEAVEVQEGQNSGAVFYPADNVTDPEGGE